MTLHRDLTGIDNHTPITFNFTDSAERLDSTNPNTNQAYQESDVGKMAAQTVGNSFWILIGTAPSWEQLGGTFETGRIVANVRKASAGTIAIGKAVYFESYDSGTTTILVELAQADSQDTMPALGISEGSISDTLVGSVLVFGPLENQDTSSFSVKDLLFVSSTIAGDLQNTRPTGDALIQKMSEVVDVDAINGIMIVAGALRVNSLPNLTTNKIWRGDVNGIPEQVDLTIIDPNTVLITGIIEGGIPRINAGDPTLFDISAGSGRIADYTDPRNVIITEVAWTAFIGESVPDITGDDFTSIAVDSTGSLIKLGGAVFTPRQRREQINIGAIAHAGSNLEDVTTTSIPVYNTIHAAIDYMNANGGIVNGSKISTSNADLTFSQSNGNFTLPFVNYANDILSPSIITNPASDPTSFNQQFQDGVGGFTIQSLTTTINPEEYDDGSGTLAAVPNNDWTFQPVFYLGQFDRLVIPYSQFVYNSKTEAIQGISEDFDEMLIATDLEAASTLLGWFVFKEGATELSNGLEAEFVGIGRGAGGGSPGATNFDQLTDTPATKISDNIVKVNNAGSNLEYDTAENVNSLGHAEPAITGIFTGGNLIINSVTQVDVAGGTGEIVNFYDDYNAPTRTSVTWIGATITIPNLGVDHSTFIYIDNAGVIQTQSIFPNSLDARSKIFLGGTFNNNNISEIIDLLEFPSVIGSTTAGYADFLNFIGLVRSKSLVKQTSDTGANGDLALSVSATTIFFPNINWQNSKSNPNKISFPAVDPAVWTYALQTGEFISENNTVIDPTVYDNAGTLTTVPATAGGKRTTIQYLYRVVNGAFVVLFGQKVYDDLVTAKVALDDDIAGLIVPPVLESFGSPFAAILVAQNSIDLADSNTSDIRQLGEGTGGGGGGGGVAEAGDTILFSDDFETGSFVSGGWVVVDASTNKWIVGSADALTGSFSAYISNDTVNNVYSNTTNISHLYVDVAIPSDAENLAIQFDWISNGENAGGIDQFDFGRIFIADTTFTPVVGVLPTVGATVRRLGREKFVENAVLRKSSLIVDPDVVNSVKGTTQRFIFTWVNDGATSGQPPFNIDNVSIIEGPLDNRCLSSFEVERKFSTQSLPNNTEVKLIFDNQISNTANEMFNLDTFIAHKSGIYNFQAAVNIDSGSGGEFEIRIYHNIFLGVSRIASASNDETSFGDPLKPSVATTITMTKSDSVDVRCFQNSGFAATIIDSNFSGSYIGK